MESISGVVLTYNEEKNIKAVIENLQKYCNEVIIADDASTDKTQKIANKMGAKVFIRQKHIETATRDDVQEFRDTYGWVPQFSEIRQINDGSACRNEAMSYANCDWILNLDADERATCDMPKLREDMAKADQLMCKFRHSHFTDGTPNVVFNVSKLFRKEHSTFRCRTHDVLTPSGRVENTAHMIIDHYQKPGHTQPKVLATLEYSVLKDKDLRSKFYLGREYYYRHMWEKGLKLLDIYLDACQTTWGPEKIEAMYYKAQCLWDGQRGDEARDLCLQVIRQNPQHRAALYLMAEMHSEPWKHKWYIHAKNATNEDALF